MKKRQAIIVFTSIWEEDPTNKVRFHKGEYGWLSGRDFKQLAKRLFRKYDVGYLTVRTHIDGENWLDRIYLPHLEGNTVIQRQRFDKSIVFKIPNVHRLKWERKE